MKECMRFIFGASIKQMNPRNVSYCFELLGLDFMVDAAGQMNTRNVSYCFELLRRDFMVDAAAALRQVILTVVNTIPSLLACASISVRDGTSCTHPSIVGSTIASSPSFTHATLRQVVLIEVNTSPALFRQGRYLTDLLPRVIEEVVQRVVDPYFPPPPDSEFKLPEKTDYFEELELVDCGMEAPRGAVRGKSIPTRAKVATSASGTWR
eukprot:gene2384-8692_t